MRAGVWWMMAAVTVLGACAGADAGVSSGTAVAPDVSDPTASVTPAPAASVLAPSQTTPATIATPPLPPPCVAGDLIFAAASSTRSDLIVTITNVGEWCEADLGQSPNVDSAMEPDVWLDPGGSAELLVAIDDQSCAAPVSIDTIRLVMNDAPVTVAIDPVLGCVASLQALYPA